MVDIRNIPAPDENSKQRLLDNIEEEENREQRSSGPNAVDLKEKSLKALSQSLELTGVQPTTDPSIDEEKCGGAFAKPKEALLLALSDLQCNDWEVNLCSTYLQLIVILHINLTTH